MELILNKTGWLRQLRPNKVMVGRLRDKNECRSMSSIIVRWNKTEGQTQEMKLKYKIDYEDHIIVAWLVGEERKEVRYAE